MRRLFNFLLQLVALALLVLVLTAAWIVFDGLNDVGDKADVALFTGRPDSPLDPQIDRVAKLYKDGAFPAVIVCAPWTGADDRLNEEVKALEAKGVPEGSIIGKVTYSDTWDLANRTVGVMKSHEAVTIMLVSEYYRMTRLKIALGHDGVPEFAKAHFGSFSTNDLVPIVHEVIALYDYLGKTFLLPTAEKLKQEAQKDAEKAKDEASHAKDRINKDLDNLPK